MNEMEHLLNVYAAKAAKNSVADFMGYCSVTSDEANRSLTEGLWLVRTLRMGRILEGMLNLLNKVLSEGGLNVSWFCHPTGTSP